jgi:hypothetical protein
VNYAELRISTSGGGVQDVAMLRNWARTAMAAVLAMGVAVVVAPAAHAGAGYFTSRDLTATIGAPIGNDQPAGWTTPWDLQRHIAYVSYDGRLVVASTAAGSSNWTWTTALADNAYPAGFLSAFTYSADRSSHIVYTDGPTRHLIDVSISQASPTWQKTDLTAKYNVPLTGFDPHGYEQNGQLHIVVTDALNDFTIWEVVYSPGTGWHWDDIAAQTGIRIAPSLGEWVTAVSLGADGEAISYIGADSYPHVLVTTPSGPADTRVGVKADDLYYNIASTTFFRNGHIARLTIRYLGADLHLHEAAWMSSGWTDTDVSVATNYFGNDLPNSSNDFYTWDADGSDHMFRAGPTGAVREYVRTRSGAWFLWTDTGPNDNVDNWASGFTGADDTVNGSQTEYLVYYDNNTHLIVADLTVPYHA